MSAKEKFAAVPRGAVLAASLIVLGHLGGCVTTGARTSTGFLDRTVTIAGTSHRYQVFVPAEYTPDRRWPVILFLHGSGERGADGLLPTEVGLGTTIRRIAAPFPAIVVFPQAPRDQWWEGPAADMALAALAQTEREYRIDPERVYLTGLSMGGSGTWYIAYRHPERFAALLIVCARITPEGEMREPLVPAEQGDVFEALAHRLKDTPIWIFHGDADTVVPVEDSRRVVAALKATGANVRYSELPGVGHNSWEAAYGSREVGDWLFAQHRTPR
jgi:predicted peptidase